MDQKLRVAAESGDVAAARAALDGGAKLECQERVRLVTLGDCAARPCRASHPRCKSAVGGVSAAAARRGTMQGAFANAS